MEIKEIIKIFSIFLNQSWGVIYPLMKNRTYTTEENSVNDWLQSNWEILVERKILELDEYLEIYGEGADLNGESSRITDIKALPTHKIKIIVKKAIDVLNNEEIENQEYDFDKLVGFKDSFYCESPPFNFVFVIDDCDKERVFPIVDIDCKIEKV